MKSKLGDAKGKVGRAKAVGIVLAQRAKAIGIHRAAFDRGGYLYHGRVKALAEGAREGGLEFWARSETCVQSNPHRSPSSSSA